MGRDLGFNFCSDLVDLGIQVGWQNGAKIDPKRHRNQNENRKGTMMAKKSNIGAYEGARPDDFGARGRGGVG